MIIRKIRRKQKTNQMKGHETNEVVTSMCLPKGKGAITAY